MTTELHVLVDGRRAGVLDRLSNGRLHFEYDEPYRSLPGATPLSVGMSLQERSFPHSRIEPWIDGLLPDSDEVRQHWARRYRVTSASPFNLLSTVIGEDCAGGVQFVRPARLSALLSEPGSVEWLDDDDLQARLRRLRTEDAAWHGEGDDRPGFEGRFSLAGRQRKTALLFEDGRWGVPAGRIPTTHILKPAIPGYADQEVNEHLCLAAARLAGIPAAESAVRVFGSETVIVVTRFDRVRIDGALTRIHQEDCCQALGVPPDRKYQSDGGPGPREVAGLLRSVIPGRDAEAGILRFADALIWNWLIGGTDAHAKNYSLLLRGSVVRLAPLYDITSGLPYGNPHDLRMAMKLDDSYRLIAHRNPWPAVARMIGVPADALVERARHLCTAAPEAFAIAAADAGVQVLARKSTAHLVTHIERAATRCAKLL